MSSDPRAADDWWANLPDSRRIQIYRWITDGGGHAARVQMPGEVPLPLFIAPPIIPDEPPTVPRPIDTLEPL